jgi:hypothetical protein
MKMTSTISEISPDLGAGPVCYFGTGQENYDRQSRDLREMVLSTIRANRYIEQEFLLSGSCSAYDPLGRLVAEDQEYVTRVLVIRPQDNSRFSGSVFIDPLHIVNETPSSAFGIDWMASKGHAWVGVTVHNGTFGANSRYVGGVKGLRTFGPARYQDLRLGEYAVRPPYKMAVSGNGTDAYELAWSMGMAHAQGPGIVKEVARVLKETDRFGFKSRYLYACGISQTGSFWTRFIENGFGEAARDGAGNSLFDAYFIAGFRAPDRGPQGTILVNLLSEADVVGTVWPRGFDAPRNCDDARVRGIEIPGTAHSLSPPPANPGHEHNAFPVYPFYTGAFATMDEWVRSGRPMPKVEPIARDRASLDGLARDADGNALGGLRPPWLDPARFQYLPRCGCSAVHGEIVPLTERDPENASEAAARWRRSVAGLLSERLIIEAGAEELNTFAGQNP